MRGLVDTAVESISLEREKQQLWLEDEADKIRHPNPTILESDSDKIVGIGEIAMKNSLITVRSNLDGSRSSRYLSLAARRNA